MEHLAAASRATGKMHSRLQAIVELPDSLDVLWDDFMDLHTSRSSTMAGPARISFTDIDAWQRVNSVALRPWQIDAIRKADREYMKSLPKPKGADQ